MSQKISIVINTYNAEKYLRRVLDAVKDFDEIVVCDMESTDSTCSIAADYGCKIVTFPKGDANICEVARDFAIHSASNDWVLVVDADEIITKELRDYLYAYIADNPENEGLFVARQNMIMGVALPSAYPDYQLRFLRQTKTFWPATIHSHPEIEGKIGYISKKRHELAIIHLDDSVTATVNRMNKYTNNELDRRKNKKVTLLDIMLKPLARFLKYYILKRGFMYGVSGYAQAQQQCFYKFTLLCKMYEKQNGIQ